MFVHNNKQLFTCIALAVTTVTASGCVSNQSSSSLTPQVMQPAFKQTAYKRTVQFVTSDQDLKAALEKTVLQQSAFTTADSGDFGEFRIIVKPHAVKHVKNKQKPRLIGLLQRNKTPVTVAIDYTLANQGGQTLAQGVISQESAPREVVYPRLESSNVAPEETMQKIAIKLVNELQPHILATSWSATVIGQQGNQHVTVGAGENIGIQASEFFITETQPIARLQVALFETTSSGQSRAVLRLLDGPLPTVGRRLIPDPNPQPIKRSARMPASMPQKR